MALKTATARAGSKIAPKASKTSPKVKAATKAASAPAAKGDGGTALKPQAAVVVTTKHLAASIADQQELPQKQVNLLLTNLVELMVDLLKKGDRLRINGLGILEVKSPGGPPRAKSSDRSSHSDQGQQEDRFPGSEGTQGGRLTVRVTPPRRETRPAQSGGRFGATMVHGTRLPPVSRKRPAFYLP